MIMMNIVIIIIAIVIVITMMMIIIIIIITIIIIMMIIIILIIMIIIIIINQPPNRNQADQTSAYDPSHINSFISSMKLMDVDTTHKIDYASDSSSNDPCQDAKDSKSHDKPDDQQFTTPELKTLCLKLREQQKLLKAMMFSVEKPGNYPPPSEEAEGSRKYYRRNNLNFREWHRGIVIATRLTHRHPWTKSTYCCSKLNRVRER